MVNNYEGLFIAKPDLKEDDVKNIFKGIGELIVKTGGTVNKDENWGKRQLAYPVKKFKEAYYYKVDFSAPAEAILKMESEYKLNDAILRAMITKK